MDSAQPSSHEYLNSSQSTADHGPGNGSRAVTSLRQHIGQISAAHLPRLPALSKFLDLLTLKTDMDFAAYEGDSSRLYSFGL